MSRFLLVSPCCLSPLALLIAVCMLAVLIPGLCAVSLRAQQRGDLDQPELLAAGAAQGQDHPARREEPLCRLARDRCECVICCLRCRDTALPGPAGCSS